MFAFLGLHFLSFWPLNLSFPFILAFWAFMCFHFGLLILHFWLFGRSCAFILAFWAFLFSRMRSEGFPFIVGVWGWTCVRFVLLPRRRVVVDSSSCRRRVVVANSLISLYWAVHSHCDTILSFKV